MSLADTIRTTLDAELAPSFLEVINESNSHNVPPGSESHFKVVIVCEAFEGKALLARHRMVNALVDMEALRIHALALHTFTASEWEQNQSLSQSPDCAGGGK